jgi:hypothetical protein
VAPASSVGGVGRRRPLRPGCQRDGGTGGAKHGSGSCSSLIGRYVRACTALWTARRGVHLDGGHGGAVERRCGREEKAGALNRVGLDRR